MKPMKMKRITALLLIMTMLLCCVPAAAFGYSAAPGEPNDVRSRATEVQPDTYSYGAIDFTGAYPYESDNKDADWYKVVAPTDGYAVVDIGPASSDIEAEEIDRGWVIEYYLNDNSDIVYKEVLEENTAGPRIAVSEGDVLYGKVYAYSYYNAPENVSYKIRFSFTEDVCWEKEANEAKTESTIVTAGETYRGNIGYGGGYKNKANYNDVDYWKYVVPSNGKFTLSFKKDSIDVEEDDLNYGWKISMFANGKAESFLTAVVKGESFVTPNLSFKKGTKIYVCIEAKNYHDYGAPGYIDYQLKISSTKSGKWENESNNTTKTAKKISLGSTYYGNCTSDTAQTGFGGFLETPLDKDWYKFTATKTGSVGIYFGRKSIDDESKDGWDITVRVNGKTLKKYSEKTSLYKASKRIGKFKVKKGQTVYIQVTPHREYLNDCPMGVDYSLKLKNL